MQGALHWDRRTKCQSKLKTHFDTSSTSTVPLSLHHIYSYTSSLVLYLIILSALLSAILLFVSCSPFFFSFLLPEGELPFIFISWFSLFFWTCLFTLSPASSCHCKLCTQQIHRFVHVQITFVGPRLLSGY